MERRILVVDDEQDVTELISTFLSFYNLEVDTINDPTEVENAVQQNSYNLLILDLMMPKIDGFTLISKLKENSVSKDIPIIVITAKTLTDDERMFLLKHNAHLLMKPYEPQNLLEFVTKNLEEEKK